MKGEVKMKYLISIRNLLILLITVTLISLLLPGDTKIYTASKETRITDKQGCTYWITKRSGKRHNSTCRWYKISKGYCTDKKVGTACKVCGG